jgi:N utilization substance protein B
MTRPRHLAREVALQVLYLWEVGRTSPAEAIEAFFEAGGRDFGEPTRAFASELVRGTTSDVAALDALIEPQLRHWRLERMAVIDRLILRMAAWELRQDDDTPAAVVIDEAVELARTYSTDESVRFVNGVLDSLRRSLESAEAAGRDPQD